MSNVFFRNILISLPIAGFMLVIDKSTWPLIIAISLPLIAARYLPTLCQLIHRCDGSESGVSGAKKLAPLFLVGATIFVLNTTPEKLVETSNCELDPAVKLEDDLLLVHRALCKSVKFSLQDRIDLSTATK